MEPVNGINKDMCGAKLQPTTVLAYILWIVTNCATYWTHSIAVCVFNGSLNLPLTSHSPLPPPPPHSLIHAICDITVAVKKVAQNAAVLAS